MNATRTEFSLQRAFHAKACPTTVALAASCLMLIANTLAAQQPPTYDVYAIRYATIPDFAVSGLVAGAGASRKMDAARTSDVARMCDRVPPVDSSALAKSRPRRYLSKTMSHMPPAMCRRCKFSLTRRPESSATASIP